jgi:hypothetical protein
MSSPPPEDIHPWPPVGLNPRVKLPKSWRPRKFVYTSAQVPCQGPWCRP